MWFAERLREERHVACLTCTQREAPLSWAGRARKGLTGGKLTVSRQSLSS